MTVYLISNYGKTLRISSVPCTPGTVNFLFTIMTMTNVGFNSVES